MGSFFLVYFTPRWKLFFVPRQSRGLTLMNQFKPGADAPGFLRHANRIDIMTVVINPASVRDKLLTAPIRGEISVALLVPITWDAVPKPTPWEMGSFSRNSFDSSLYSKQMHN